MTVPADHIHISERESDGSWEDCTWDSGLEWYRLVYDARKPATHAEAEALRRASGEPPTGGSNMGDLARGIKVRYGTVIPARITGFAALKSRLTPGKAAVVQGSMSAFGPGHVLSKWQTNFEGAHAVMVMNTGGDLLWCDPLAPKSANVPVAVTWRAVERYVKALPGGQHVVGPIKNLSTTEETDVSLIKYLPGFTATVRAGSNVRSAPRISAQLLHATTERMRVQVVGTVKGDVDPANGSTVWYEFWHDGRSEYTATDNIVNLTPPSIVEPADPTAAIAAAVAPLQTTIDQQAALIAELKTEVAATTNLRSALKGFLS